MPADSAGAGAIGGGVGRRDTKRPAIAPAKARQAQPSIAGPKPLLKSAGNAYPPLAANTAAQIAMPNTPPSWRSVLYVPDALPIIGGGTEPITAFAAAGTANDTPHPAIIIGATSSQYGRPVRAIAAIQARPAADAASPPAISGRSPSRPISEPATGATTVSMAQPGSRRTPVLSGP